MILLYCKKPEFARIQKNLQGPKKFYQRFFCLEINLPSKAFLGGPRSLGSRAGAEGGGGPEGPVGVREEVKSPVALCCIFKAKRTQEAMANK